nr:6-bladed beta-propeller [uncultured Macellibacteroides sp.]
MKRLNFIWVIILIIVAGCSQSGIQREDLITVNVTAQYPKKELILQDFMDVEYIPLETTDEFLCQGSIWAVGKNIIVATNFNSDGNIFIFDRKGKALKKINRKGQGDEEYTSFSRIVLDEENDEIFVNNDFAKKILVYDLDGNFKRRLSIKEYFLLFEMYNFDKDNLICHDTFQGNTGQSFMIISKHDGSITKEIVIPFKEKKTIRIRYEDDKVSGQYYVYTPQTSHQITPCFNDYILTEYSADTVYRYSPDHTMKPFIVRAPSVQTMNPEIFLLPSLLTDRYCFMQAIEKTIEFSATDIVYDKQEDALYRYKVYNDDYNNDEEAFLKSRPLSGEIPSCQYLEAWKLVQDYKCGRLKGRLKEIAAKLDPEDNPVIMLIKHKK